MATYTSSTKNTYYAKLTVTTDSQSIANNTSTLSYKLVLYSGSGGSFSSYTIGYSIKINGTEVAYHDNSGNQTSMSANSSKTIKSGTKTITHNSDGTKTVAVSFKIWTDDRSYLPVSLSKSGEYVCYTIPRASTVSCPSEFNVGSSGTVSINRKSSSFTHTATNSLGNTGMSATSSIGTSFTYTPPTSLFNSSTYASSTSRSGTMTIQTKSGSTNIDSAISKSFIVKLPENNISKPTCSFTSDLTETGSSYLNRYGVLIADKSKLKANCTSSGKLSATIKSHTFNIPGSSATISNGVMTTGYLTTSSSKATFSYYVKDSRGFTSETDTISNPYQVVEYKSPSISLLTVTRVNDNGIEDPVSGTKLKIKVNYYVDPIAVSNVYTPNTATVKVYQLTKNSSGVVTDRTEVKAANGSALTFINGEYTGIIDGTYLTTSSYSFEATIVDELTTDEATLGKGEQATVLTAKAMMSFYGSEGVALGRIADSADFHVAMNSYIEGDLGVGAKTATYDGNSGIFLDKQGRMVIQRDSSEGLYPYIGFMHDNETSLSGEICVDPTDDYMKFYYSKGYYFGNKIVLPNDAPIYSKDTISEEKNLLELSPNNNLLLGYGLRDSGNTYIYGGNGVYINGQTVMPKVTLWEGNWSSGTISVLNTDKYSMFLIYTAEKGTGELQGTVIPAIKHTPSSITHIRGVGGTVNDTPTDYTYHFSATANGNTWTFVNCDYNWHGSESAHGARVMCNVVKIVGLI